MDVVTVESLGEPVGEHWARLQSRYVRASGLFSYSLPLSSTPLPIYSWAIEHHDHFLSWDATHFVLMDEQVDGEPPSVRYIPETDPASYELFAKTHLLKKLDEATGNKSTVLKPSLDMLADFSIPIHMLVLALGVRGNYANVMPGTPLDVGWHIANLIPEFQQVHTEPTSQSYAGARFRQYGMSLGPRQVLDADNVLVIVSGSRKRPLYQQLMSHKSPDPEFPLSVIFHPGVRDHVTVYVTEDVAGPTGG